MNPKILLPCLVLLLSLRAMGFASPTDVRNAKPVSKHAEKQKTESAATATIKVYVEDAGATYTLPAPPKGFQFSWTKISPKRDIMITEYFDHEDYVREIWLSLASDPSKKEFLFDHQRSAEVKMSDDEKWIVINNLWGSDVSEPLLYKRTNGLKFEESKNADISGRVWRYFAKENHLKEPPRYHHKYVDASLWGSNSHTILLHAWGYIDSAQNLDPWFCILNVETLALSLDLRELNNGAFAHSIKKKK